MEPYIELDSSGFTPEEFADVKQCLETLFSIRAGSQPLDRNLGINYDGILGYPINIAQNMFTLECIEKVDIYEPRVDIESVNFEVNTEGQIMPYIHCIKREEE